VAIPGERAGKRCAGVGRGERQAGGPVRLSGRRLHLAAAAQPAAGQGPLLHLALATGADEALVLLLQAHAGRVMLARAHPAADDKNCIIIHLNDVLFLTIQAQARYAFDER
jgi:hypothetical protein